MLAAASAFVLADAATAPGADPVASTFALHRGPADDLQFDGGEHGDASNECEAPSPKLHVNTSTTGLVVAKTDDQDHYRLDLSAKLLDLTVHVALTPGPAAPPLELHVFKPGCAGPVTFVAPPSTTAWTFEVDTIGPHTVSVVRTPGFAGGEVCHDFCGRNLNLVAGYNVTTTAK